jgi:hypothetical protein
MDFVPLQWIDPLSNFLYTYVLIYLLVGAGSETVSFACYSAGSDNRRYQ